MHNPGAGSGLGPEPWIQPPGCLPFIHELLPLAFSAPKSTGVTRKQEGYEPADGPRSILTCEHRNRFHPERRLLYTINLLTGPSSSGGLRIFEVAARINWVSSGLQETNNICEADQQGILFLHGCLCMELKIYAEAELR